MFHFMFYVWGQSSGLFSTHFNEEVAFNSWFRLEIVDWRRWSATLPNTKRQLILVFFTRWNVTASHITRSHSSPFGRHTRLHQFYNHLSNSNSWNEECQPRGELGFILWGQSGSVHNVNQISLVILKLFHSGWSTNWTDVSICRAMPLPWLKRGRVHTSPHGNYLPSTCS